MTAEQRIRDGLVALADFLTDREDYDIPHEVIRTLCPDVDTMVRQAWFEELLRETVRRRPDLSQPLSLEAERALDYMTGARS